MTVDDYGVYLERVACKFPSVEGWQPQADGVVVGALSHISPLGKDGLLGVGAGFQSRPPEMGSGVRDCIVLCKGE